MKICLTAKEFPVHNPICPTFFRRVYRSPTPSGRKAKRGRGEDRKGDGGSQEAEHQNRKITKDLPVLETEVIEPAGVDLSLYRRIDEEITKIVKHKPRMLCVKGIIRPKYALKDSIQLPPKGQKGVKIAPCR